MKLQIPNYFSPNFLYRVYIDATTKKIVLSHTLTNKPLLAADVRKKILF